jgi:hypothetical protein
MREIIELALSFVDLVKAELELSKRSIFNLGIALIFCFAATVFLICAIGMILYGVHLALLPHLAAIWSAIVVGLLGLVVSGVLLWIASFKVRRGK